MLVDIYSECNKPNFNHFFLAALSNKKWPIFTPNFDMLIEFAMIELGIPKKEIRPIIAQNDWEEYLKVLLKKDNNESNVILKLHGSFKDISTGNATKESLQATLEQISANKKEIFCGGWRNDFLNFFALLTALSAMGAQ